MLLLIGVVTHHAWFTNLSIITHGDWIVDFTDKATEFFNLPQAWSNNSLGGSDIGLVYWPLLLAAGTLAWPVALLTPIFM